MIIQRFLSVFGQFSFPVAVIPSFNKHARIATFKFTLEVLLINEIMRLRASWCLFVDLINDVIPELNPTSLLVKVGV